MSRISSPPLHLPLLLLHVLPRLPRLLRPLPWALVCFTPSPSGFIPTSCVPDDSLSRMSGVRRAGRRVDLARDPFSYCRPKPRASGHAFKRGRSAWGCGGGGRCRASGHGLVYVGVRAGQRGSAVGGGRWAICGMRRCSRIRLSRARQAELQLRLPRGAEGSRSAQAHGAAADMRSRIRQARLVGGAGAARIGG
ncbi:hypothetical protein C8R46DRAFT_1223986 [Mycena filopes]|nr:hypothetical protein C8R46DRAFT_1223986 [Mycena filopes]